MVPISYRLKILNSNASYQRYVLVRPSSTAQRKEIPSLLALAPFRRFRYFRRYLHLGLTFAHNPYLPNPETGALPCAKLSEEIKKKQRAKACVHTFVACFFIRWQSSPRAHSKTRLHALSNSSRDARHIAYEYWCTKYAEPGACGFFRSASGISGSSTKSSVRKTGGISLPKTHHIQRYRTSSILCPRFCTARTFRHDEQIAWFIDQNEAQDQY